ncbi:MAG: hypothetical protein LUD02_07500 [Tannerellaceae bacterium]|nr:hypothetical protein [Tannerellaceae bacterium]MCD8264011.1 hypothetical protein [Tannerellaceae bacterium]
MKKIILIPIVVILILTGCTTTQLTSSWSVKNPPSNLMNKVLVVGVMADREEREKTEDAMVGELRKYGINASSAFELFGPKGFGDATEEQIAGQLRGSDYTSVMIVSLINKDKELRYVPGTYYGRPYYYGSRRYYRRYWTLYDNVYTPGYYTTTTNYVLEAEIYTVSDDDQLVYSAQTKTTDPNNASALAESFSKTIVSELRTKGLVSGGQR